MIKEIPPDGIFIKQTIEMNKHNPKLIRITTVPVSLAGLIRGQHRYMTQQGFEVVGVSSSGKELDEVRRLEGIRTVTVEMTFKMNQAVNLGL